MFPEVAAGSTLPHSVHSECENPAKTMSRMSTNDRYIERKYPVLTFVHIKRSSAEQYTYNSPGAAYYDVREYANGPKYSTLLQLAVEPTSSINIGTLKEQEKKNRK